MDIQPTVLQALCGHCDRTGVDPRTGAPCTWCDGDGVLASSSGYVLGVNYRLSNELWEKIDLDEYAALSDADKSTLHAILSQGIILFKGNTNTHTILWAMFDGGTTTRDNLSELLED